MATFNYERSKTGFWVPTQYPVKYKDDMTVPKGIARDFNRLTSLIEDKYAREYLKICAFYNKLFPSLKQHDWSRSSYNTVPFTIQEQERVDTGTGISANYLKGAIDLVVARIGNTIFDYKLIAEQPTVLYEVFRDEVERLLRTMVRRNKLNRLSVEAFHDAAILGFSHAFVDPWTHAVRKIADWELGVYESEFNDGRLKRVMIRDFQFPVSGLAPYCQGFPDNTLEEIASHNTHVDLRLYIDCFRKQKYVCINQKMSEPTEYDFDEVLLATFSWDLGVRRTNVTSLFDMLYPLQRSFNKLMAKKTQLLSNYKGPVPIFSQDCDIIVKSLSNAAGEALFLDTNRNPASLMTVLEPTPLDPQLNAEAEALKAQMFELAGVQNMTLDIENYRSAAAIISLDQMRDSGFQSQLASLARFIQDIVMVAVKYMAKMGHEEPSGLSWGIVHQLLEEAFIDIKPVHPTDQTAKALDNPESPDYRRMAVERFVQGVLSGWLTFEDIDFSLDWLMLKQVAALRLLELSALGRVSERGEEFERLRAFLVSCFVQDVQTGEVVLAVVEEEVPAIEAPLEEEAVQPGVEPLDVPTEDIPPGEFVEGM